MQEIIKNARNSFCNQIGAKAYLNRQYKTIAIVGVVVLVIISFSFSILVGLGYLIGAALSGNCWLCWYACISTSKCKDCRSFKKRLITGTFNCI